jgi:hypothetical protein
MIIYPPADSVNTEYTSYQNTRRLSRHMSATVHRQTPALLCAAWEKSIIEARGSTQPRDFCVDLVYLCMAFHHVNTRISPRGRRRYKQTLHGTPFKSS